jgi:hypothetical protein
MFERKIAASLGLYQGSSRVKFVGNFLHSKR